MRRTIPQAARPVPLALPLPHATPAELLDAVRAVCRLRDLVPGTPAKTATVQQRA